MVIISNFIATKGLPLVMAEELERDPSVLIRYCTHDLWLTNSIAIDFKRGHKLESWLVCQRIRIDELIFHPTEPLIRLLEG